MKEDKKAEIGPIRSELTHEQEVSLTPPEVSWEVIHWIQEHLKVQEKPPKTHTK